MEYLSDEDEDHPTRMSSPDTSSSEQGRGAALVKRPWTPEEDTALIAAVHKYGAARWSMIATQLSTGRVGKQCRERWNNHLCPEVKKTEWSEEEDRSILQGVAVLGTRWCEIVKAPPLVGRTDNAIKNRFYSLQRRMKARQCGGVRHGRRPANAAESEEEEREPPSREERIVAIATELAFATDECERDRLIEQLTTALHEGAPEGDDAYCNDDASDLGPLESPSSLAQLSDALRSHHGGFDADTHAPQPFEYDDEEEADPSSLLDQIDDPPTPLPMDDGRAPFSGAGAPSASGDDAFLSSNASADASACFGLDMSSEAVQASVSMVADLLRLPHSPRQTAAVAVAHPPTGGLPTGALPTGGLPTTKLPPSPRGEEEEEVHPLGGGAPAAATEAVTEAADSAMDDAASAATISPDAIIGGAALEDDAWLLPAPSTSATSEKRRRDEEKTTTTTTTTTTISSSTILDTEAAAKPMVRAPVLASPLPVSAADKSLTEKNGRCPWEAAPNEPPPSAGCSSAVQRARPVRADADASSSAAVDFQQSQQLKGSAGAAGGAARAGGGEGGSPGSTSPNEVMVNVSAALLGGRQAYKACLAPLRLPPRDESCDVHESPKRQKTPNGSAPGGNGLLRGGSGLRIVAAPLSEAENAFPVQGPVIASCAQPAAPTVVAAALPVALMRGAAATGTDEPGACAAYAAAYAAAATPSSLQCASPMIDLSIFGDLFAEDGTCCANAAGCSGMCSSSSQVAAAVAVASLMPCKASCAAAAGCAPCAPMGDATALPIISPETAPTSLASTTDASPASRKSVRRPKTSVRFAAVA